MQNIPQRFAVTKDLQEINIESVCDSINVNTHYQNRYE